MQGWLRCATLPRNVLTLHVALVAAFAIVVALCASSASADPVWSPPVDISSPPDRIDSLQCPSLELCVAVDGGSVFVSSDPGVDSPSWAPYANPGVGSISCPSESLCAGANLAKLFVSTNPAGGAATWTPKRLPWKLGAATQVYLNRATCRADGFCLIFDSGGRSATTRNVLADAPHWRTVWTHDPFVIATACPSPAFCVSGDGYGKLLTLSQPGTARQRWSKPQRVFEHIKFSGLACASPKLCVATGIRGDVLVSTSPARGWRTWHRSLRYRAHNLGQPSCPSAKLCVILDDAGNEIYSTNPAATKPDWHVTHVVSPPSGSYGASMSCPAVSLCVAGYIRSVMTSHQPS